MDSGIRGGREQATQQRRAAMAWGSTESTPENSATAADPTRCSALLPRAGSDREPPGQDFIRHPSGFPVRFRCIGCAGERQRGLEAPGLGGITFPSRRRVRPGTEIVLTLRVYGEHHHIRGLVVFACDTGEDHEIGLGFTSRGDAYRARMIEQACHIEAYRREVRRREGRVLSRDLAAMEWIERFSATFPRAYGA